MLIVFLHKMCTPNKKAKLTNLTPCRRMGLNRSPRNFTPPFKDQKIQLESPLADKKKDNIRKTPKETSQNEKNTNVLSTPVKQAPKSKNKLVFEDTDASTASKPIEEPCEELTMSELLRRKRELAIKKRKLRELQSKEMKADDLIAQIALWKNGCREVLDELVELTKSDHGDRNEHVMKILNDLNIPCELIGYDPESEDYKD